MRAIGLATMLALLPAAALAQALTAQAPTAQAPTAQEQAACRADGLRLCSSAIGRPADMHACLSRNRADLSPACRAVIDARGG
ncbi:hypothetical protein [Phreatobacter sp.]|uniref:hypothetical protein n=1 Tax=Phreatobacter sp. TaxID=1966341 RepID=UPI003F6FF93F